MKSLCRTLLVFALCGCIAPACKNERSSEIRDQGEVVQDGADVGADTVESKDARSPNPPAFSELPADTRISVAQSCSNATCESFEFTLSADGEARYTAGEDSRDFKIDSDTLLEILNDFAEQDVMYLSDDALANACEGRPEDGSDEATRVSFEMRVGGHSNTLREVREGCDAPHPAIVELARETHTEILKEAN